MCIKRRITIVVSLVLGIFMAPGLKDVFALNENTHRYLNEKMAVGIYNGFSLDYYLKTNIGFTEGVNEPIPGYDTVVERISLGGYKEDITGIPYLRSVRHFHDPIVSNWNNAGFKGSQSSIIWAETKDQSWLLGNYSWPDARQYFYDALTATNANDRNENYVECFRAVGQVMHLVEDVSVPEHTRDDFHYWYNYENRVLKLQDTGELFSMFPAPADKVDYALLNHTGYNAGATIPIAGLFDADQYTGSNPGVTTSSPVGLAEYTNANFFSRDTVDGDYPYPSLSDCQKGSVVLVDDPRNPGGCFRSEYRRRSQ